MFVNYDKLAKQYQNFRKPDKRIAARISKHTKGTQRVINVGAGTGAYEPTHCDIVAIEPSQEMISKRKETAATIIQGFAENLPFDDNQLSSDISSGKWYRRHDNLLSKDSLDLGYRLVVCDKTA